MEIDDAVRDVLARVLQVDPALDGAEVVADVERTCRLDAGEDFAGPGGSLGGL